MEANGFKFDLIHFTPTPMELDRLKANGFKFDLIPHR